MEGPPFLKKKYELHNTPEVESAAKRTEMRTGEKVSQKPTERIANYIDRFKEIIDREDPEKKERGMEALKQVLHDKFIIKPEIIPEAYFTNQQRLARELGHGDIEVGEEQKEQLAEVVIADQESSLDNWIDYLSSKDATYPDWLKYYAFRSVLGMGAYDKEKHAFGSRSEGTIKPFPDINREALAYVLDVIEKKAKNEHIKTDHLTAEGKQTFEKLLQGENFAKLYAYAIEKVTPASQEALANVEGTWVKYDQGSDHMPLVESLQGHGTGWCTAGESTAQTQLQNGDFYVYYTKDAEGKASVPRAAIRMQGNNIGEVRGVAEQQNLDPYIGEVVKEKLAEFPDGAAYEKKSADMKTLTAIEQKTKAKKELSKDELVFLYEIDSKIEGFGYQRDPRIEELRTTRNTEEDMPIVLDCEPSRIARKQEDINEDTKAYVGPLFPSVFQKNIEHLYTAFPEGKIREKEVIIGGKTKEQLEQELKKQYKVGSWVKQLLDSKEFTVTVGEEQLNLVRVTVKDLGFAQGATTKEIYDKAQELGLDLCPAEVGPQLRLQYEDQPDNEYIRIGMNPIKDADGGLNVFCVSRIGDDRWLHTRNGKPVNWWSADLEWVFVRRKYAL